MEISNDIFGEYASFYDLIYQDKDYAAEVAFISSLIGKYCFNHDSVKILDLACGTGRHTQLLASMGYSVEGSDISAHMIRVAKERAENLDLPIRYYNESFQTCDRIDQKYDVVIAMFSAIGYLTDYRDLEHSLANIRRLLRKDGVFIFDFWNGNSVLRNYSPVRFKRVENGEDVLMRVSRTELDSVAQIATVNFDFVLLKAGCVIQEFSEVHPVRYYFPQEMMDFLMVNKFEVTHRCPFLKEDSNMIADEWNLTYLAKPFQ
jgi:SAM-dependent methyltransferase